MVTKQTPANRKRKPQPAKYREIPPRKDASLERLRELAGSVRASRKFDVMEILERD
jgi:hypothetical protein